MDSLRRAGLWVASLALIAFVAGASPASAQTRGDLAIVVHPDTPVSDLSFTELRQVFLGERQYWNANVPVVLLIRAPTSAEVTRYCLPVAPAISVQLVPAKSQRSHCHANAIGSAPSHVPVTPVRERPTKAAPSIAGEAKPTGTVARAAFTCACSLEAESAVP